MEDVNFQKNNQNIFEKISAFALIIMPILLITGPLLPDLVVSLFSLSFLFYCTKKNFLKDYGNIFLYIITIFFIILIFSSINSYFFKEIYKSSIFYFRFFAFIFFSSYLIIKFPKIVFYTLLVLAACFLIVIGDGLLEYFTGSNLTNKHSPFPGRIRGFFDELIIGSYLTRLFPIFLALFLLKFNYLSKSTKVIFFIVSMLLYVLVFLSGERTAFYLLIIFSIYLLIFINYEVKKKLFIFFFALLVIGSFTFVKPTTNHEIGENVIKTSIVERMILKPIKTLTNLNIFSKKDETIIFSNQHSALYKSAFKIFLDNKLIGSGPNSFRIICNNQKYYESNYSCSTHPHNFYMQLLAETGLVGLSFVIIFFSLTIFFVIYSHFITNKLNNFQIILIGSIIINLFPFAPSGNFFNNYLNILMYYPGVFLIWSFVDEKNKITK
jgi:O-antigen ligase